MLSSCRIVRYMSQAIHHAAISDLHSNIPAVRTGPVGLLDRAMHLLVRLGIEIPAYAFLFDVIEGMLAGVHFREIPVLLVFIILKQLTVFLKDQISLKA